MKTEFTPGPWHWVDAGNDKPVTPGIDQSDASLRTVAVFGESKTEVIGDKRYTSFALPKWILDAERIENPADARLIAAAPDLFAALERLSNVSHCPTGWSEDEHATILVYALLEAKEALAKATGKD